MNAHKDSPTGQQWHIRYRLSGRTEFYWSSVFLTESEAVASFDVYERAPEVAEADLYIREATPWRKA